MVQEQVITEISNVSRIQVRDWFRRYIGRVACWDTDPKNRVISYTLDNKEKGPKFIFKLNEAVYDSCYD